MSMAAAYWQNNFAKGEARAQDIMQDAQDMVHGIQLYLQHPYTRDDLVLDEVMRVGEMSVVKPVGAQHDDGAPIVLLVPSLINKAYILDLMHERSMLRYLSEQGIGAYLLDWGDVAKDDASSSFDGVIEKRLMVAVAFLSEQYGRPVHVFGYCMGGTLCAAAASIGARGARGVGNIASLITMAAPWDFHGGAAALTARVKFWAPTLLPSLAEKGEMSVDWLQMLFSSLEPATAVEKFMRFARMDQAGDGAALFVAVEDWLNDGVAMPQGLAQEVIQEWFFDNAPGRGAWNVCEHTIAPEEIDCPAFVIASSKDRLVEFESAKALADGLPNVEFLDPQCGHIGMIAGRNAKKDVWGPIVDWLHAH